MKKGKPEHAPKFTLGRVVATRGVLELMNEQGLQPFHYLGRHVHGDWGDVGDLDKALNEDAVANGCRIFSAYNLADMPDRLWVITEADRSVTTLLLPREY
jgi:hypothetical protein